MPVWLVRTAIGAVVCRSHTRRIRSNDPAAISVLSMFTAMSVISDDAPRNVANRRPSVVLHNLTRKSSAPVSMYLPDRSNSTQYTAERCPRVRRNRLCFSYKQELTARRRIIGPPCSRPKRTRAAGRKFVLNRRVLPRNTSYNLQRLFSLRTTIDSGSGAPFSLVQKSTKRRCVIIVSLDRNRLCRPAPSNDCTLVTLGLISRSRIGPMRLHISKRCLGPMCGYFRS